MEQGLNGILKFSGLVFCSAPAEDGVAPELFGGHYSLQTYFGLFLAKIPRPASIIASILALASSVVKKRSIFAVFMAIMATHYNLSYRSVLHQMSIIPLGIYPGTPKVLPKNI